MNLIVIGAIEEEGGQEREREDGFMVRDFVTFTWNRKIK